MKLKQRFELWIYKVIGFGNIEKRLNAVVKKSESSFNIMVTLLSQISKLVDRPDWLLLRKAILAMVETKNSAYVDICELCSFRDKCPWRTRVGKFVKAHDIQVGIIGCEHKILIYENQGGTDED